MTTQLIGQRVKRREDPSLITGQGQYVDDIKLPGMAAIAFLRSPHAHARIRGLETAPAVALPGVLGVFSGKDLSGIINPVPTGWHLPNMKAPPHPAIATDRVRYKGDIVAAVVAQDRYIAEDALNQIQVDYEPLPAVVSQEEAIKPGAPALHEEAADNVAFQWTIGGGDAARAFDEAEVVVRQRIVNQRLIPNAMEARGAIARWDNATGELTLWSATQVPHLVRLLLALTNNLEEHKVRVIAPDVGGGFGSKLYFYPEEAATAFIARRIGRPVKWTEGRQENYLATIHGRDHVQDVEIAAKRDGTITGLRTRVVANLGAYLSTFAAGIPSVLFGVVLSGPYRIPNVSCEVIGAFTNTTPVDAYRGAGRPEATYLLERMVDLLAAELKMDPAEVRRKNFIPADAFPYTSALGVTYDSGNYPAALDRALELANYEGLRRQQAAARAEGRLLGIGLSSWIEVSGAAPSQVLAAVGAGGAGWESSTVQVVATGKVTVLTGSSSHGQGHETAFAQIVADRLGIPMEDVDVVHGDTGVVRYGVGTFASRSAAVGGTALYNSLEKVREKARKIAAHLMEASEDDIVFEGGKLYPKGVPDKAKTFQEIALAAHFAADLPSGVEPVLDATTFYNPENFTWPFGTHCAVVEVDRETGNVRLLRYIGVDDCGNVINPLLVEGQVHGGIVQGLGQAWTEGAVYDPEGQLLSASMMDYAIPRADQFPTFELDRTVTPSPVNPLGVKGVGEAGTIASTPAFVNAVMDALAPMGIRHVDMPLTPERLWRAITASQ